MLTESGAWVHESVVALKTRRPALEGKGGCGRGRVTCQAARGGPHRVWTHRPQQRRRPPRDGRRSGRGAGAGRSGRTGGHRCESTPTPGLDVAWSTPVPPADPEVRSRCLASSWRTPAEPAEGTARAQWHFPVPLPGHLRGARPRATESTMPARRDVPGASTGACPVHLQRIRVEANAHPNGPRGAGSG